MLCGLLFLLPPYTFALHTYRFCCLRSLSPGAQTIVVYYLLDIVQLTLFDFDISYYLHSSYPFDTSQICTSYVLLTYTSYQYVD